VRVAVVFASRYGSTAEIAEAIAAELRAAGHDASAVDADGDAPGEADAYVLGSAVYAGRWLKPMRKLAERHAEQLRGRPVWLFSSGPLGEEEPEPAEDPVDVEELMKETGAREHVVFAGKLDHEKLNVAERLLVRALKAPEGGFRDWDAIRDWARAIVPELAGR
jgi:menaquinone-dependent protoporphyrinogen oxidase